MWLVIENIGLAEVLQIIGICVCVPVIAASVTLVNRTTKPRTRRVTIYFGVSSQRLYVRRTTEILYGFPVTYSTK